LTGQAEQKKPRNIQLTERDLHTMRWIGEQYAARLDQIQRILGKQSSGELDTPGMLSESAARVWLNRMKEVKAIDQALLFHAQPRYIWLTSYGLDLVGLDFKPLVPKPSTLHHCYQCGQIRLFLAKQRPAWTWKSERYLRSEHAQAAREVKGRRKLPDVPDAELTTPNGVVAVEAELTDKEASRLYTILRSRANTYYTTWYFCSREAKAAVEAGREMLREDEQARIIIYDLPNDNDL
jgi:hypothetical protein